MLRRNSIYQPRHPNHGRQPKPEHYDVVIVGGGSAGVGAAAGAAASLRVMGTAFATGQAAGVVASRQTNAEAVRRVLRDQGALLDPADMPAPVPTAWRQDLLAPLPGGASGHGAPTIY